MEGSRLLPKCPVGRIIGSTHNVWQEVGGEVCQGLGVSLPWKPCQNTLLLFIVWNTQEQYTAICVFPIDLAAATWVSALRGVRGRDCCLHLTLFSGCSAFHERGGRGHGSKKMRWGGSQPHLKEDAGAPVWSCCFVPPQRVEIAQINLLFAWLGQYVCVLCARVCKCSLSSTTPPSF